MLKESYPETKGLDQCCQPACREATVVEILEMRRQTLIEKLKDVDDAIHVLQHINPDQAKALKTVLAIGHSNY